MSDYANANVLITGGLGFIGSSLAHALVTQGANVTVVDSLIPQYGGNSFNIKDIHDKLTVNVCDVRDPHAMAYFLQGKDYLFNLAGQTSHLDSMLDPQVDLAINAEAQLSILEACRKYNPGIRIVFASTRQIYGKPDYLPVDEAHPIRPVDVNGINKLAGEWYHILYNNVYGIQAGALRLTNTYGPRIRVSDARQTFLGIWVRRLLEGDPILIYGDGMQLRNFTYIDDCVDALLLAATNSRTAGKTYNLGGTEVVSLNTLAAMMLSLGWTGTSINIPFPADRKAIDIGDYYGSFELIRNDLGWEPRISLKDGLTRTLAYYAEHRRHYWSDPT